MPPTRIFVSYAITDDPHETEIAGLLIEDLQNSGVAVITENEHVSDTDFTLFFESELASCQYLILVQTPATCQSQHVQTAVQTALTLLGQQHILRLIAIPSKSEDEPPFWRELRTFDASQDYPRIREKVFLELGLTSLDATSSLLYASPLFLRAGNSGAQLAQPGSHEGATAFDLLAPSRQSYEQTLPTEGRPAFLAPRNSSLPHGSQDERFIDRPSPLPLRSKRFFRWGLIFSLAAILILAGGLGLFYRKPWSTIHPLPGTPGKVSGQPTRNLLAQDSFQRPDQQGWGTASDGHSWGADAANGPVFSIQQGRGTIIGGRGGQNATLGPRVADAEVFFTGSINFFHQSNLGAILRWVDAGTFYKAYIDGQHLVLLKSINGRMTRLASVPFRATANMLYNLRFRVQGTMLSAQAWQQNTPEPTQWMVTAQDGSLQTGLGGVRVFSEPADSFTITAFQETAIPGS